MKHCSSRFQLENFIRRRVSFEVAFYTVDGRTGARGYWGTYNGPLVAAPGIEATETDKFMGRANALFRVISGMERLL